MLRFSVFLFYLLTAGIVAKPLKPGDGDANEAVQKGWVSIDDKGMASWGLEVEPPEDMDKASFDIDPSMKIWRKVQSEPKKRYQMAEEDLDELRHPSTEDLLKAYAENKPEVLPPVADTQVQNTKNNQKAEQDGGDTKRPLSQPEEDLDEVYHGEVELRKYLAPLVVGYRREPVVRAAHSEPEEDKDDMYHEDVNSGMQVMPEIEVESNIQGRFYLEPEEDKDDIFHKDIPEMILYNGEAQPAAVDWPTVKRHTAPEEDRDAIYHD